MLNGIKKFWIIKVSREKRGKQVFETRGVFVITILK